MTKEDELSNSGLAIIRNIADSLGHVTHFKISDITNGRLYKYINGDTTAILNNSFIYFISKYIMYSFVSGTKNNQNWFF